MASKYEIFCKIVDNKSFSKTANEIGYTQSAISQIVKSLERDLNILLIDRGASRFTLTPDGNALLPYFRDVYNSEKALLKKASEIHGMYDSTIKIGTFSSVSRTILPAILSEFKHAHPNVNFTLKQGTYSNIAEWIQNKTVDFGFVIEEVASEIENTKPLFRNELLAVFSKDHPLASKEPLSLSDLAEHPLILIDEGDYSIPLAAFEKAQLTPKIECTVYDDYSIFAMLKQRCGFSMTYDITIKGFEEGLILRHVQEKPGRTIVLAWNNPNTMSYASRKLLESIQNCPDFSL